MRSYDVVVVGAGATGCVLANRLSEDPSRSVLLIEAGGPDKGFKIHMPRAFPKALADPAIIHSYPAIRPGRSEPEYWLRGKTLGGSTAVNGLVFTRGFRKDYDEWAAGGCAGWGWSDMARCFRALEGNELEETEWRGHDGPFKVTEHTGRSALNEAIIAAATAMGVPRRRDLNEVDEDGFGYYQRSIYKGRRMTAAKAFLHPIRGRRNLAVLTETEVERITFDGRHARGVVVRDKSGRREITGREIILCAGALISPKLLMLSGVGPAGQLKAAGIEPLVEMSQVGQNMRDHLMLTVKFRISHGSSNREFLSHRLVWNVLRWQFLSSGPCTYSVSEIGGYVTVSPKSDRPDTRVVGTPLSMDNTVSGFKIETLPGFTVGGYAVRPQSRGELRLQSPDPAVPPLIAPNYLGEPIDREIAAGAVRWLRRLGEQPALRPFAPQEIFPGPSYSTDDELVDAFHRFGGCSFHTVGTCRMGPDPQSVVDLRLRVRGIEGLRVADISAMPSLPSAGTQAPALAFAWRASELILEDFAAANRAAV